MIVASFFRPVIVTDVVSTWPARSWTTEFFNITYGNEQVAMKAVKVKYKGHILTKCVQ